MKQGPCTPPCQGLFDDTKYATKEQIVRKISLYQTKQNKTKQTTYFNGWTSVPYAIATTKIKVFLFLFYFNT